MILELWSAASIATPSIVCLFFLLSMNSQSENYVNIWIASLGCFLHFPFSASLHLYRALGKNPHIRVIFFKFDVSFIHFHSLVQSFSWNLEWSKFHIVFHILSVVYIWMSNPLLNPSCKRVIDVLTVAGVLLSSFQLQHIHFGYYISALFFWMVSFVFYAKKPLGDSLSSIVFHVMLGVPQTFLILGLACKTVNKIKKSLNYTIQTDKQNNYGNFKLNFGR
jgi:hypothetical protein